MILRRELIRQTNHVWRGAYLVAVNDIPRNVEDYLPGPSQNRGVGMSDREGVRGEGEVWRQSPVTQLFVYQIYEGRYCRCAERYSGGIQAALGTQCCNTTRCIYVRHSDARHARARARERETPLLVFSLFRGSRCS